MDSPAKYEIVIEHDNCSASLADGSVVVLADNKTLLAEAIERLGWFKPIINTNQEGNRV